MPLSVPWPFASWSAKDAWRNNEFNKNIALHEAYWVDCRTSSAQGALKWKGSLWYTAADFHQALSEGFSTAVTIVPFIAAFQAAGMVACQRKYFAVEVDNMERDGGKEWVGGSRGLHLKITEEIPWPRTGKRRDSPVEGGSGMVRNPRQMKLSVGIFGPPHLLMSPVYGDQLTVLDGDLK